MNVKRLLKHDSNNSKKIILENGQEAYTKLSHEFCEHDEKKSVFNNKKLKVLCMVTSFVMVCLLAAGIVWACVVPNEDDVVYLKENENMVKSSIEEIDTVLNNTFSINLQLFELTAVTKVYDMLSGDVLYYNLSYVQRNAILNGDLQLVVNPKYQLNKSFATELIETSWQGYKLLYSYNEENSNGLKTIKIFGLLRLDDSQIYFSYMDIDVGQERTPHQFLTSILTFNI